MKKSEFARTLESLTAERDQLQKAIDLIRQHSHVKPLMPKPTAVRKPRAVKPPQQQSA